MEPKYISEVILYRGYNPFTKYHGHPSNIGAAIGNPIVLPHHTTPYE